MKVYTVKVGPFNTKSQATNFKNEIVAKGYEAVVEITESVAGDIDGDGKVTAADARLATRAMAGLEDLTPNEIARGDINGNGKIDPEDARAITRKMVGLD